MYNNLSVEDSDTSDTGGPDLSQTLVPNAAATVPDTGGGSWEKSRPKSEKASGPLPKRAEKYANVLWKYKISECNNEGYHDYKTCKHWHSRVNNIDRRRDPRRRDANGVPINAPPWAYSLSECKNRHETMFHPDRYKMEKCSSYASPSGCSEPIEYCPFRHDDLDQDVNLVITWRTTYQGLIDWESYLNLMLNYKVDGPCQGECSASAYARIRCPKWHKSDVDRRLPANFSESAGWLPTNLQDLPSKSARSYDPRVYKKDLCDRHPNCNFGIYCTFAHTERERELSARYREQLRDYLMQRNSGSAAPHASTAAGSASSGAAGSAGAAAAGAGPGRGRQNGGAAAAAPIAAAAAVLMSSALAFPSSSATASPQLLGGVPAPGGGLRTHVVLRPLQPSRPRRLVLEPPDTVCRICWNSTAVNEANGLRSHRPSPAAKACAKCGQDWNEIRVHKSSVNGLWVHLREPPEHMTVNTKLAMCSERKSGRTCTRQGCTFAHSEEELAEWNYIQSESRTEMAQMDPEAMQQFMARASCERPWKERAPPIMSLATSFKICHHEPCKFVTRCNFPHTDEELVEWEQRRARVLFMVNHLSSMPENTLASELSTSLGSLRSSSGDVALSLDTSANAVAALTPGSHHVFTVSLHSSHRHRLGRVSVGSESGLFALQSVERDDSRFPIISEGPVAGDCQALTPFGAEEHEVLIHVAFTAISPGTFVGSLIVEVDTRNYLRLDLTANVLPEESRAAVSLASLSLSDTAPAAAPAAVAVAQHHSQELFPIPAEMDQIIKSVLASAVVSREAYREYMHAYLFAEEQAIRTRLLHCVMLAQPALVSAKFELKEHACPIVAPPDELLIFAQLGDRADEMVAVSAGDVVTLSFAQSSDPARVFRGVVELAPLSCLLLRCPRSCLEVIPPSGQTQLNAVFQVDRRRFIASHHAIRNVDLDLLFPTPSGVQAAPANVRFFDETLAEEQRKFVSTVVGNALTDAAGRAPFLLVGPGQSGKTTAVAECVKQLVTVSAGTRVLVAVHSDAAALAYMTKFFIPFAQTQPLCAPLLACSPRQRFSLPEAVVRYSAGPATRDVIKQCRIVVTTVSNAHHIAAAGEQPFTHVFVDDASQVSELDALSAISLGRNLVVAGHPRASGPPSFSALGFKAFGDPIINRLSPIYAQSTLATTHVQHMARVFVGNSDVIRVLSPDLLYSSYVTCTDERGNRHQLLGSGFSVFFSASDGEDTQVNDGPGFVNEKEIGQIESLVLRLQQSWPAEWGAFDASQIAVAVPYVAQALRLRTLLWQRQLRVVVGLPSQILDSVYRVVLVSSVRNWASRAEKVHDVQRAEQLGLLEDPYTLSMVCSRARNALVVVGHPATLLSCVGAAQNFWIQFIDTCFQNGTFTGPAGDVLQGELEAIKRIVEESASGLARTPSTRVQATVEHALPRYGRVLWSFKTAPCMNSTPHAAEACWSYHSAGECRRDPRRVGADNIPINFPPWSYTLAQCENDMERAYHPENYKTKTCSRLLINGRCEVGERCAFRHVSADNVDSDADLADIHQWWADMTAISRDDYMTNVTIYKRMGPCGQCFPAGFLQCDKFHTEADRCGSTQLAQGEWSPPVASLSVFAKCYDPRFFKLHLCNKHPSCGMGRRCPQAHGSVELAAVRVYLRDLRLTLLQTDSLVQRLLGVALAPLPEKPFLPSIAGGAASLPVPGALPAQQHQALLFSKTAAGASPHVLSYHRDQSWVSAAGVRVAAQEQLEHGVALEDLLFDAVQHENAAAIRTLVFDFGADVNRLYTNPERQCVFSMLHFACDGGLYNAAYTLVRLGADRAQLDSNGKNALVRWTMALEGVAKRTASAPTVPNPRDREELQQRAQMCRQCALVLQQGRAAEAEEREAHVRASAAAAPPAAAAAAVAMTTLAPAATAAAAATHAAMFQAYGGYMPAQHYAVAPQGVAFWPGQQPQPQVPYYQPQQPQQWMHSGQLYGSGTM